MSGNNILSPGVARLLIRNVQNGNNSYVLSCLFINVNIYFVHAALFLALLYYGGDVMKDSLVQTGCSH